VTVSTQAPQIPATQNQLPSHCRLYQPATPLSLSFNRRLQRYLATRGNNQEQAAVEMIETTVNSSAAATTVRQFLLLQRRRKGSGKQEEHRCQKRKN
ncbi:hypothetical protein PIB30_099334, partial [Stylosanthes scabra]|nr:hypothetical protein [Stylosanthes scabra]